MVLPFFPRLPLIALGPRAISPPRAACAEHSSSLFSCLDPAPSLFSMPLDCARGPTRKVPGAPFTSPAGFCTSQIAEADYEDSAPIVPAAEKLFREIVSAVDRMARLDRTEWVAEIHRLMENWRPAVGTASPSSSAWLREKAKENRLYASQVRGATRQVKQKAASTAEPSLSSLYGDVIYPLLLDEATISHNLALALEASSVTGEAAQLNFVNDLYFFRSNLLTSTGRRLIGAR